MADLVLDDERRYAISRMESGENVFLTGGGGVGKSMLVRHFLETTKRRIIPLGSTGIAAINVGGQTAHSAFKLRPGMTLGSIRKTDHPSMDIFQHIDGVLIDEISMSRADFIDMMDKVARLNGPRPDLPMGGLQIIGVGDLCQLPPVVTEDEQELFRTHYAGPYFFNAKCYPSLQVECIELERVFRQKDPTLINVLNRLRRGETTREDLEVLNTRVDPDFDLGKYPEHVYLATKNRVVDKINQEKLAALPGASAHFRALVRGTFPKGGYQADELLELKVGARVMLLVNDKRRGFVNGDAGTVLEIDEFTLVIDVPRLGPVRVGRTIWENNAQEFNKEKGEIETRCIGTFMQFPVRLAWAITAHKSQGQTFGRLIVDLREGTFAHGQAYVLFSRATSLEGLVLPAMLTLDDLIFDPRVRAFMDESKRAVLHH